MGFYFALNQLTLIEVILTFEERGSSLGFAVSLGLSPSIMLTTAYSIKAINTNLN